MSTSSAKVYPNAPLVEAVFEIRYPAEPAIECHRDEVYAQIRNDLTMIIPEPTAPNPTIVRHRYSDDGQSHSLAVSINTLGYMSKKYTGFDDFKKEAISYFQPIGARFKLNALKRVGLRYINVIPFARKDGCIPVTDFLHLGLELPTGNRDLPQQLRVLMTKPCNGGTITTRVEAVQSPDKTSEALLLDFDYSSEGDLNFSKISEYLEEGHSHTKKLFESLITDEYRRIMQEEMVK